MLQVGIFIAVTAAALALLRGLAGVGTGARGQFRRRLTEEFTPEPQTPLHPLYKDIDALDDPETSDDPSSDSLAAVQPSWRTQAEEFLRQAGVRLNVQQAVNVAAGCAVGAGVVGFFLGGWLAGLAAFVAGGVAVPFVLNAKRKARRESYLKQLIGAFELMSRVLRAGQSVPEAFRAAVEAFEAPLAEEFGRCLHQIEHGLRPEAAYRELAQRAGILELRLFVVAMTIQRQSGGNLSEVLERLAGVIRTRMRMRQRIRALTAEGRMQAVTLSVLPVLTFVAMYFINRPYAELLVQNWKLLAAAAACIGVGSLWIRHIMNFEG